MKGDSGGGGGGSGHLNYLNHVTGVHLDCGGGSVGADGSATFSGTATVDMGDGALPLPGVPFTVTASAASLGLILNAVALPTATVTAGSITLK